MHNATRVGEEKLHDRKPTRSQPDGACLFLQCFLFSLSGSFTERIRTKESMIIKECLCSPTGLTSCYLWFEIKNCLPADLRSVTGRSDWWMRCNVSPASTLPPLAPRRRIDRGRWRWRERRRRSRWRTPAGSASPPSPAEPSPAQETGKQRGQNRDDTQEAKRRSD